MTDIPLIPLSVEAVMEMCGVFTVFVSECRERWQSIANARFSGGTPFSSSEVDDCLQLCLSRAGCLAADYSEARDECRIHTNSADLTQTIAADGYLQYLLLTRCDNGRSCFYYYACCKP